MNALAKRGSLSIALAIVSLACEAEVGPCLDDTEARRVVYDVAGTPAFQGQAIIIANCSFVCHSDQLEQIKDRYGAPEGLDYNLQLAGYDDQVDMVEVDRLQLMHNRVHEHRRSIWAQVSSGRMPIGGEVGAFVADDAPVYYAALPDVEMPPIDDDTAREALRNWLACGSPIVERTAQVMDAAYVPVGWAVDPVEVRPLDPNWSDIYTRMIEPRCNGGPCHGDAAAGELDLQGEAEALAALLAVRGPSGEVCDNDSDDDGDGAKDERCECNSEGQPLIVPGQPDASLFLVKIAGTALGDIAFCGRLMPIGSSRVSPPSVQAIRTWIENGAMPGP